MQKTNLIISYNSIYKLCIVVSPKHSFVFHHLINDVRKFIYMIKFINFKTNYVYNL